MENCIANEHVNNDFLSQSYVQGIERITGTKDSILDFQIPKKLLEVRERTWDNLFNKYSKEMSDDIEINVDTLEPEEEEEKTFSEEGSCGHRVPMRKPATLVQYWINTGNPPYKMLLDENESSETGSSLSEKEITSSVSPLMSLVTSNVHAKIIMCESESSCTSVDTAAYILSNVNVTKKADTIAIMEGAKCIEVKSLKNIRVSSNDKIEYMKITRIDREMRKDDNDVNVDVPATELHSMSRGYIASEIDDGVAANARISADTIQSSMYLPCEDKIDKLNTSQRNLDVQTINDIASIFRQFDKTSKRLTGNDKNNDVLDQRDKAVEMDTFHEKQNLENMPEIIAKDTSSTAFHRKKLYTGRDSPVDLILTETHSINRLSQTRQNPTLHPALDPDGMIKRKTFLIDKDKRKRSAKKSSVSNRHETNNKHNVKLREIKIVLERLPTNMCFEGSRNIANTNIFPNKTNVSQNTNLQINPTLQPALDLDGTIERKTFLIDKGKRKRSTKKSFVSNRHETNNKHNVKLREIKIVLERLPTNMCFEGSRNIANTNIFLNKTNVSQNTNLQINPTLQPALDLDGTIKRKTFLIDKGKRKRSAKKSFVSNRHETNNKNDVKLREIKILLERLSTNVCLEKSRNVVKTNNFPNKTNVSQNTNLQINDKRKFQICEISKILARKNGAAIRPVGDNYSLRTITRSEKNNGQISDTIDIVTERGSQVFDKIESDSTFQQKTFRHKNHSKISQDHNKYSVLTFTSSDEDDFVRSIHARKRLKVSINDNILDKPSIVEKNSCDQSKLVISDKNKYRCNRNSSIVICSSKKTVQREIGSIKEKKKHSGVVKIKSFRNSTRTATATSRIRKNERDEFFSSEDDNDADANNSDKLKERISFFNSERNTNHKDKRRSKRMIKKNGINHKDDIHVILFQTKTFDTNSSDSSEESNTSVQEKTFSNTFLENINFDILPENKKILDKCKNSVVIQQDDVTSTVKKLLAFQTKSYYDSSDSSETL